MGYLPTPNEPTQTLQQRRRAAFDTFDKDQSGFIEGKDLTRALRLLGLKPDKFEDLEFSDGTGKVVDYKVLLLDYETFIRIIAFNSRLEQLFGRPPTQPLSGHWETSRY